MEKKEIQTEAIILRKLRELKGFSRKEASILLGLNFKAIERFENGRTNLNQGKIEKIINAYGYSYQDFCLCKEGKTDHVQLKFGPQRPKVIENNSLRRSYRRLVTKEVKTLKVLRRLKGLTQYQASTFCGFHESAIGHIENGRIEIPAQKIQHIVKSYGFSMAEFEYHLKSDQFVTDIQDNCINIIRALSEEKLKAVYPLLQTFNK